MITTPMTGILASSGWAFVTQIGCVLALGLAAAGSALGIGAAGRSAAGAWAREAKAGQTLRFTYIILIGLPLSQTLYAFIVMNNLANVLDKDPSLALTNIGLMFGIGLATGLAELMSAWMQGVIGAAGIRAICEGQGKGFAFIIIAMGIAETVGIFAMVFLLGRIPTVVAAAEEAPSVAAGWLNALQALIA